MVNPVAEREERRRDLRGQIGELSAEDSAGVLFIDNSPGRRPVTVYSVLTGEPITFPEYMVGPQMQKRLTDGRFAFVSSQDQAPAYKRGKYKCFLHKDSPERPMLTEIGLDGMFCEAAHLGSTHAKRIHAMHRHKQEWAAYQEYQADLERERDRDRQEKQLEATLRIAGMAQAAAQAAPQAAAASAFVCDVCGEAKSTKLALAGHKRSHKEDGSG